MYKFGMIVLIPFPFTDLSSSKVRPALIISSGNQGDDVVVCFISSGLKAKGLEVSEGTPEFLSSGLKVDPVVRFDKIATLNKKLILGELGYLSDEFLSSQKELFYQGFGF